MIDAIVRKVNHHRGLVVFETYQGYGWFEKCTVFEFEENDALFGDFDIYGYHDIIKKDTGEKFYVYVADCMMMPEKALRKCS